MNIHYKRLKSILSNSLPTFWAGLFVIIILIILIYYNTIASPFNFDDESAIVDNKSIRSLSNLPNIFADIFSRPVLYTTLTLNYHIGGLDPIGYHIVNIGLHMAVSILIYLIVWHTLEGQGANNISSYNLLPFLSALIFAIHPINTEPVTYIISRSSVLSTFFYLLSLLMFIQRFKVQPRIKFGARFKIILFYFLTLFFFILALGSKEDAVTLPAILLLYHFFFISEEKIFKDYLKKYRWVILSLILLAISYPLLRYIHLGMVGTSEAQNIYTPFTYFITGIKVIVHYYMKLLLLPINLNIDPDIRISQLSNFYVISAFIFITVLLITVLRRKNELLSFSILWYLIALTPTSSIFPLNDPASEHRIYLPFVGFCIFMAYSLILFGGQKKNNAYPLYFILIIILFSTLTIKRNFIWGDEVMVWKDSTRKSPNKPRPYYNMAISYEKMGLFDKAIWGYKGTIDHLRFIDQPRYWTEAHLRLAGIYVKKGLYMNAIPLYDRVLKIYPEKAEALNGLAVVNLKMNNFDKAKDMLEKAIKIKPDYAEAYNNLGTVYARIAMFDEAIDSFKRAIRIKPAYIEAMLNLKIVRDMARP